MAFAPSIPISQLHFPLFSFTNTTTQFIASPTSIVIGNKTKPVVYKSQKRTTAVTAKATAGGGLYSAQQFELTPENVDAVLEDVRPYLIADGGNVDVVSVQDGVVSLKLQGACESCPSSTTTMKMGIERVLKEKFGDAVKEIVQVYDEQPAETTVESADKQIPQFVLDAVELESADKRKKFMVGCTQPRRVAAMSVSRRVAEEMDVLIGKEAFALKIAAAQKQS